MSPDQLAIQLLQLEKLYHERVLFNLTVLQENWGTARSAFPAGDFCVKCLSVLAESRCKEKKDAEKRLPAETDNIGQKHIETLRHICGTHLKLVITQPFASAPEERWRAWP